MSIRESFSMSSAAIGERIHSGWGALVAVSNKAGTIEVIERRRIVIATPGTPGKQPYHFAKGLELPEAEKFLGKSFVASKRLAAAAIRDLTDELLDRQYHVVGAAVLSQ
jgi:hypothetical protein